MYLKHELFVVFSTSRYEALPQEKQNQATDRTALDASMVFGLEIQNATNYETLIV